MRSGSRRIAFRYDARASPGRPRIRSELPRCGGGTQVGAETDGFLEWVSASAACSRVSRASPRFVLVRGESGANSTATRKCTIASLELPEVLEDHAGIGVRGESPVGSKARGETAPTPLEIAGPLERQAEGIQALGVLGPQSQCRQATTDGIPIITELAINFAEIDVPDRITRTEDHGLVRADPRRARNPRADPSARLKHGERSNSSVHNREFFHRRGWRPRHLRSLAFPGRLAGDLAWAARWRTPDQAEFLGPWRGAASVTLDPWTGRGPGTRAIATGRPSRAAGPRRRRRRDCSCNGP